MVEALVLTVFPVSRLVRAGRLFVFSESGGLLAVITARRSPPVRR